MKKRRRKTIFDLTIEALEIDGAHHKQWYLERILEALGYDVDKLRDSPNWEDGIAP